MSPKRKPKTTSKAAASGAEPASGETMRAEAREVYVRTAPEGALYGVYSALVIDVKDPDAQGRVKVRFPWLPAGGGDSEAWARLATLMAGNNRGSWFVPDSGDEVLVAFEAGDPRRPYVIGALWNDQAGPPATMDGAGRNDVKRLRSRNGVTVELDDTGGHETLLLRTPGGHRSRLRTTRFDRAARRKRQHHRARAGRRDDPGSRAGGIRASVVEIEAALLTADWRFQRRRADTLSRTASSAPVYTGAGNPREAPETIAGRQPSAGARAAAGPSAPGFQPAPLSTEAAVNRVPIQPADLNRVPISTGADLNRCRSQPGADSTGCRSQPGADSTGCRSQPGRSQPAVTSHQPARLLSASGQATP
jgi:hypothetical protein